eukprot:CAMPEP_0179048540 /NCGR_PEP_ID=MMETSP0796-20121207/19761_1 /TAXON_ID=73915 /ORGANISM="Pyrodinium bahamense, Strain pbaha01" /LENGTH=1031 /DNA_ID=CAMNT_0020745011 /DNA_START=33 /DNA_END=3129 /DNA_ORIENTATION=-
MKPFGNTHSHGDLHSLEVIEDRSGARRKHGLPTRYTKGRFLGKGGFAKCYEVQDMETREIYAAKIVAKASIAKPRAHAKLKSEIAIHRSLNHEKVVKFHDHFEDSDYVYIILELCPNQTLNEFMRKRPNKRLSEAEAMFYIYDLIVALKYLHRRRVIHRDLKLGNLFLDADVRLKVGDFGLAAQLEHDSEKRRTICGTPNYIAPEILEGKHGHSYEVDIWSLGVILYTMIIGRPPFETSDVRTTYRRIRYNQYSFPDTVRISEQAKDLINAILRTEPHSRLSLDEILGSTWFQSAQRLPPPMPGTVSAFTITPRVGSSSARSETPERGAADFARIDSPVPRFPLRDRSPSTAGAHNVAGPQQPLPRGQSASPLLPSKQPPAAPSFGGAMTPGRYAGGLTGGRPPLAHRGNEENVVPVNANVCQDAGAYNTPLSPKQTLLGLGATAVPCRPQSAHLASCGSSVRIAPNQATPQMPAAAPAAPAVLRGTVVNPSTRDPIPATTGTQVQAKLMGFGSARSTTCSPRQPAAVSSGRLVSNASTPKENRSRSARALGSSGSEGGASASSLHTKTTPVVVRAGTQALPGRNPPESPNHSAAQQLRATQQLTPCCGLDGDIASARTPLATPTQSACDRRQQLPVQKQEWNCSSPALTADGPLKEVLVEPCGRSEQPFGADPFGNDIRSARSTATHPEATSSGAFVPASSSGQGASPATQAGVLPELWVAKWVDYSSKYGVGYILSDGSIGVYFNDSTKIVLAPEGQQFDYVTRRTQEKPEVRTTHTFEDYPEDLKKKVTLLRHFKNYMHADVLEKKDGATVGESSLPPPQQRPQLPYEAGQVPYVKKWTRNKHAIMFQLSNKIVQVVFFDKTEAVLSSKSHTVTYVDKRGQVCSYPLSNVLDVPSPELAKRLRYTKDILVNLLGARTSEFAGAIDAHPEASWDCVGVHLPSSLLRCAIAARARQAGCAACSDAARSVGSVMCRVTFLQAPPCQRDWLLHSGGLLVPLPRQCSCRGSGEGQALASPRTAGGGEGRALQL